MSYKSLLELIEKTPIADTHEHLYEEDTRTTPGDGWRMDDFSVLFSQYTDSDLISAGLPPEDMQRILLRELILRKSGSSSGHSGLTLSTPATEPRFANRSACFMMKRISRMRTGNRSTTA